MPNLKIKVEKLENAWLVWLCGDQANVDQFVLAEGNTKKQAEREARPAGQLLRALEHQYSRPWMHTKEIAAEMKKVFR